LTWAQKAPPKAKATAAADGGATLPPLAKKMVTPGRAARPAQKRSKLTLAGGQSMPRGRDTWGKGTRQTGPVTSGEGAHMTKQRGGGDCLLKTQGFANLKKVERSLTPARCRKVKPAKLRGGGSPGKRRP